MGKKNDRERPDEESEFRRHLLHPGEAIVNYGEPANRTTTTTEPTTEVKFVLPEDRPSLNQDDVVHPWHYNVHPSGVECITIIQEFTFNIGAAVKHLWRAGLKGGTLKDLRKAAQYIEFEIARLEKAEAERRGE